MAVCLHHSTAGTVLGRFGLVVPRASQVFLGNRGGFSGACLWQIEAGGALFCLRAWPTGMATDRLRVIHRLMATAHQAGLEFVPVVRAVSDRATWVQDEGRLWELTTWQPGQADFHARPEPNRLEAAITALARLHGAWSQPRAQRRPCPAILRRLDCAHDWLSIVSQGWHPPFVSSETDSVQHWAQRAWELLPERLARVPQRLALWARREVALQPCLCDLWHDHVLFQGDVVTGIVDYGSTKTDHIAVDLARLLGSLVGDDARQRSAGLDAYSRIHPLTPLERTLIDLLDETGTLLAGANWLKWIYFEGRRYENMNAVAARLAEVVKRIERWPR